MLRPIPEAIKHYTQFSLGSRLFGHNGMNGVCVHCDWPKSFEYANITDEVKPSIEATLRAFEYWTPDETVDYD